MLNAAYRIRSGNFQLDRNTPRVSIKTIDVLTSQLTRGRSESIMRGEVTCNADNRHLILELGAH
jgi:hypothetical protein